MGATRKYWTDEERQAAKKACSAKYNAEHRRDVNRRSALSRIRREMREICNRKKDVLPSKDLPMPTKPKQNIFSYFPGWNQLVSGKLKNIPVDVFRSLRDSLPREEQAELVAVYGRFQGDKKKVREEWLMYLDALKETERKCKEACEMHEALCVWEEEEVKTRIEQYDERVRRKSLYTPMTSGVSITEFISSLKKRIPQ
jgi:hypothetical protein